MYSLSKSNRYILPSEAFRDIVRLFISALAEDSHTLHTSSTRRATLPSMGGSRLNDNTSLYLQISIHSSIFFQILFALPWLYSNCYGFWTIAVLVGFVCLF